jgi:hypothetical protein
VVGAPAPSHDHATLDAPVAARTVTDGRSIIPTLSMMDGVIALAGPPLHDMFVLPPKDSPTPSR